MFDHSVYILVWSVLVYTCDVRFSIHLTLVAGDQEFVHHWVWDGFHSAPSTFRVHRPRTVGVDFTQVSSTIRDPEAKEPRVQAKSRTRTRKPFHLVN